ncbi:MAG: efflux RND transporter periplasmic adaptor subunit [Planctomycetes bacterium]|nr:efflux RND transporter periplasmic adaptor subunit [Planctomycetota bacterium]
MRKLITAVIVLGVLAGVLAGAGMVISRSRGAGGEGAATTVLLHDVAGEQLVERVNAPGTIEPQTHVSISARVSARVAQLPFQEGDRVAAGDVLVRLDAADLEAALASADAHRAAQEAQIAVQAAEIAVQQAQIEGVRAALEEARRDLERQRNLRTSGDTSQSLVEQAQRRTDELDAQLRAAEHTLRAAELRRAVLQHNLRAAEADIARARDALSYTTIASPIAGVVTRLNAKEGELVVTGTMNNPGTVIMEVADLSRMLLVAEVDEADIGAVAAGQEAQVRLQAYGDETFAGSVESIALAEEYSRDGTRHYPVKILLDASERRIYCGLTGEAEILTRRHEGVLTVPSQAVLARRTDELPPDVRRDNPRVDPEKVYTSVVYRFAEGKAVVVPVDVGPSSLTRTVIEAGLDGGDRVVVGPYKVLETLRHDQRLADENAPPASQSASAPAP